MRWRLLPREPYFFEAFVSMSRELQRGATILVELLAGASSRAELVARISEIEEACDTITHDVITKLNKTFVTPIDREDVHALASALDDVIDAIEDAAELVVLHRVGHIRPGADELARVVLAQTAQLVLAAENLPELTKFVPAAIREIKRLEEQADEQHHRLVGALFDEERDAIEVVKWKEIFDFIEEAADRAEEAAHVLESIYVKQG